MNFSVGDMVDIIYIDRFEKISKRQVRIISTRKDHLIVYCYTKQKLRTLLIQNILGAKKINVA